MASPKLGRKVRPSGGFELFAWFFMRISGLALVFLAVGHLFIMHILNNVETINYAFVASRWTAPRTGFVWRMWDVALISLAVIHGSNGLRQVLYEYLTRPGRRVVAGTLIWTFATALIALGGYSILMFQPDADYIKGHPLKLERNVDDQGVAAVSAALPNPRQAR